MDSQSFLETLKKADRITRKKHGSYVTLQRAIFLSWWCSKGDCKFCYMAVQKNKIAKPEKAKRNIASILAEAMLCNRIGWEVEFLSGGYGAYGAEELREIAEMVAYTIEAPVWLNVGVLNKTQLKKFGEEVVGITGAVETVSRNRSYICPSKPLKPIVKMLKEAKKLGFKTGITIILGLGENTQDLQALFNLIEELELDWITYYSLNPHKGTIYENTPPPASIHQASVIALTRIKFPHIKITGGTWIDQLSNIGLMLLAGANSITKYPLFSMFGNKYGRKVEEEIKFADRQLLGTFSDVEILKGDKLLENERKPQFVFGYKKPKVSSEAIKKVLNMKFSIEKTAESYIKQ